MGLLIYTWNELTHKNLCMFVISTQRRWLAVYLFWLLQRWIDTMQTQRKHFKEDRRSATWNENGTVNKVRRSSLCECVETTEHVGTWNDVTVMGSECVRELNNLTCTCYWFTNIHNWDRSLISAGTFCIYDVWQCWQVSNTFNTWKLYCSQITFITSYLHFCYSAQVTTFCHFYVV